MTIRADRLHVCTLIGEGILRVLQLKVVTNPEL